MALVDDKANNVVGGGKLGVEGSSDTTTENDDDKDDSIEGFSLVIDGDDIFLK